jgi:hypothetical protein
VRLGARYTPTRYHKKTQAITSSQPNLKTLVLCEMLAHPRVTFHPCICLLHGGATTISVALIDYDDMGCCHDNHEETIVIDYFLYTDKRLR